MTIRRRQKDDTGPFPFFETAVIKKAEAIPAATLRSGTSFRDIAAANIAANLVRITSAEIQYLNAMKEFGELACVGAGV